MFYQEPIRMFHRPSPTLQASETTNRCWQAILGRVSHGWKGHWVTGFDGCLSGHRCCQRERTAGRFKVKAVLISSDISHLRLDQALPDMRSCFPWLALLLYVDLFFCSLCCCFFNLLAVYVIDGLVCHSMSGNLLVIYYNVRMCSVFFPSSPTITPHVR